MTWPVLAGAALLVRWQIGSPVIFRQERAGQHGVPFTLCKLRTMRDAYAADGSLLPDKDRLTRLGRFLRASSIDELPGLFHVLRGEMSLVGPRPLYAAYVARYTPEQARRLAVKPGITGLAQVRGRNALAWEEKFALDVWYVDHWSLGLDLRILAETVIAVLRPRGIAHAGEATLPVFMGTQRPHEPDETSA